MTSRNVRLGVLGILVVSVGCVGQVEDVDSTESALGPMARWPAEDLLAEELGVHSYAWSYANVEGPRTYDSRIILYTEPGERVATVRRRTTPEGRTTQLFEPSIGHVATFRADGEGDPIVELSPEYQALTGTETMGCIVACLNCARNGESCIICKICMDSQDPEGPCDPDTDPDGCECTPHFHGLDCGDGLLADLP